MSKKRKKPQTIWNLGEDKVSRLQCDLGNCLRTCFMVEMHNWIQALTKAQQTCAIESMFYQKKSQDGNNYA